MLSKYNDPIFEYILLQCTAKMAHRSKIFVSTMALKYSHFKNKAISNPICNNNDNNSVGIYVRAQLNSISVCFDISLDNFKCRSFLAWNFDFSIYVF